MLGLTVPEEYFVDGLEAVHYSKPDDTCEAVTYKTPNGIHFTLAKDFMGIQFCKRGCFWPAQFTAFHSMAQAVEALKGNTTPAIAFFEAVADRRRCEHAKERGSK